MSTKALITGIAGFVGSHLAEHLLEAGLTVEGTLHPHLPRTNLEHLGTSVALHACDIRSYLDVADVVKKVKPDLIFHLAAISSVSYGEGNPEELFQTNLSGTLYLLEAFRQHAPGSRLLVISSPEVYGKVALEAIPIKEDHPVRPIHLYGLSKALAERVALFYRSTWGLSLVILRPFNHIGPRQADSFVCSSFCKQVALIDLGRAEPVVSVGNLSPIRDFTDVRDIVRAYRLAAERCEDGKPYHIASGTGITIEEILKKVVSFTDAMVEVREEPSRKREVETPVFIGDASQFVKETGWTRHYSLLQSLQDCFQYWKDQFE